MTNEYWIGLLHRSVPLVDLVFELDSSLLLNLCRNIFILSYFPLVRVDFGQKCVTIKVLQNSCDVKLLQPDVPHGFFVDRRTSYDPAGLQLITQTVYKLDGLWKALANKNIRTVRYLTLWLTGQHDIQSVTERSHPCWYGLPCFSPHEDGVLFAEVLSGFGEAGKVSELGLESPGKIIVFSNPIVLTSRHYQLELNSSRLEMQTWQSRHLRYWWW